MKGSDLELFSKTCFHLEETAAVVGGKTEMAKGIIVNCVVNIARGTHQVLSLCC